MAVAALQLHNDALITLFQDGVSQWDDSDVDFTWALLSSAYTQADTDTLWSDVSANEISDGDYAQQAVTTRTVANNAGEAQFKSDPADFGANVTIEEAKYLVLVAGTATSVAAGDKIIGTIDLDDGGGIVFANNGEFSITQPAAGWFRAVQA